MLWLFTWVLSCDQHWINVCQIQELNKHQHWSLLILSSKYLFHKSIIGSIDRWMDKEVVVLIYNGTLLSHKKAWNWVICRDLGGPRVWHTKPSRKPHFKRAGWGADVTLIITKQLKITVVHNDVNVAHATELFSIAAAPLPFFSRSVQSLSRIQCFATPWSAARQASLSNTNSGSLLKLLSIEP